MLRKIFLWLCVSVGLFCLFFQVRLGVQLLIIALLCSGQITFAQLSEFVNKGFVLFSLLYHKFPLVLLAVGLFIGMKLYFQASYASYFEGDEWVFFRQFAPLMESNFWWISGFFKSFTFEEGFTPHITPIADMGYLLEFKLFQLHFEPYLTISLILHFFVTMLLALFAYDMTNSRKIAIFSAVFFGFSAVHLEAVVWILASLYTQLSVLFGLLSLIVLRRSMLRNVKPSTKTLLVGYGSLLCSLWSKETAIIFPVFIAYLLWKYRHFSNQNIYRLGMFVVLFFFCLSELIGHRHQLSTVHFTFNASQMPWTYALLEKRSHVDLSLLTYRLTSFFLKMISSSIIPAHYFQEWSIWLTKSQFLYYNQDKAIRGPNYLIFIQQVIPELLQYTFGSIFLLTLVLTRSFWKRESYRFGVLWWFFSVIPIWLVLVGFPWLKYDAYIGSRHLYHVLPGVALVVATLFSAWIDTLIVKFDTQKSAAFVMLLIAFFLQVHYSAHAKYVQKKQEDSHFTARKVIIDKIQRELSPPAKKMIFYSSSNKSYYGFAEWMLPFPIPFYQILPVVLSTQYHPNGLRYPDDFFKKPYNAGFTKGLVAQGYYESGEYGVGYFLEKVPLIKTLERERLSASIVYAYRFDGDKKSFENITGQMRDEIQQLLDQRKQFDSWKRYGSQTDRITFEAPADFEVLSSPQQYVIMDGKKKIMSLSVVKPEPNELFSQFVAKQVINGTPIGTAYKTIQLKPDLDIERLSYTPNEYPNTLYTLAGNNKMFYKIEISDRPTFEQILRTIEFIDQDGEILYPDLPISSQKNR